MALAQLEITAFGFSRVFFLEYHGFNTFFSLWATARYRKLALGEA
ncbi:MAG: hypothetical protein KAJ97_05880 [Acidobacteria bacterium]|nr:hypothetical protein [Acidobacteriota bacterium]